MRLPAVLQGDSLTRLIQGAVAGAILTMVVGFGWGGWTLGSTAQKMADTQSTKAVVLALTPACVRNFEAQADMPAQWAAYRKVDTWQHDRYLLDKGYATPVGSKEGNRDVASACADKLNDAMAKLDKQAQK